ncbi:MAG: TIM barrel protein [Sedimentisphaerales bacterium]|nr:TIM barrel protein [Sedimentisphaerales bacterium]
MPKQSGNINRRSFIKAGSAVSVAMGLMSGSVIGADNKSNPSRRGSVVKNARIQQSVSQWCYGWLGMEELAAFCAEIGLGAIDLLDTEHWPVLKKHGLVCSMSNSHGIAKGLNRIENHSECLAKIRKSIEETSEAGFPNVICFSGNREGLDDDEGLKNCKTALKQIVGLAEKKNVTICMELLNSKRNHKDYMCDRTAWGVELVKQVGSDNLKLLYDIYHMQVQEGDVIATIKESADYIGHYHTGGVPGRHEIDDSQELYYPAIMKAILDTGFTGFVAHEFVPKEHTLDTLAEAVGICDV